MIPEGQPGYYVIVATQKDGGIVASPPTERQPPMSDDTPDTPSVEVNQPENVEVNVTNETTEVADDDGGEATESE